MKTYSRQAGAVLRQLRTARKLTLQQAAQGFSISVAALSRKERGIDSVTRHDIRRAIHAYILSPAETSKLWAAAGMLPDAPAPKPAPVDVQSFAGPLLNNLLLPAFVIDSLGYVQAWNQAIETMWQFSRHPTSPLHILERLFDPSTRGLLGENWSRATAGFIEDFYRRTLALSGSSEYSCMIRTLEQRCGDEFVRLWNEAGARVAGGDQDYTLDTDGVRVIYQDAQGEILFLVVQSIFRLSIPYRLLIHVPFGPENHRRYETLFAAMEPQRVYFAE